MPLTTVADVLTPDSSLLASGPDGLRPPGPIAGGLGNPLRVPESDDGSLDLLLSFVDDMLIAVDIEHVLEVADLAAPRPWLPPAEERLDLAALWHLARGAGHDRRAVVVTTARGPRLLVLGSTLRVAPVLAAAVQPTPAFLAGAAAAAGIRAVLVAERIGFVVDVDGLVTLHEGSAGHE